MDPDAFAWLLTPPGQQLLARAEQACAEHADPVARAEAVRRTGASAERATTALAQAELRIRAVAKFGELASRMYFTPDGLEQATRLPVARHRAGRLTAATPHSLLDLGCGIGGDLVAFADAGLTAAGVDTDPLRVAIARANLEALDLPGAVQVADGTTLDLSPFDVVYADPARRGARGRVFDAEGWTPPWSFITSLLRRASVVKLAPGLDHDLVPGGIEAEWVSDRGDVKEAVLWSSWLATCARRATVLGAGGLATLTEEDDPWHLTPADRPVGDVGAFLYEPDGAVIRAGLVTAVAAGVDGRLVDPRIAWVTADAAYSTPFARGYRVVEEVPFREKPLRAALRARGIGALTIKTRGVAVTPEQLRPRLALRGDSAATLVLTRVADKGCAFLVEPLSPAQTAP
ncbi:class I SAM-dependent methyltransferase [Nocardioides massiliensis]|uniref:SAM-dependent methyltransferase n=1 Tax=Nocardioides massiliensis TaxID=1325935 RepID=A0ABT9NQI1_9ACTN|nr:methyltransferase domain-containing protein [Nocardioides massiliensis]MDP9822080.1 SAM-dependent methyltransferase [Nocardioides massiliensis]